METKTRVPLNAEQYEVRIWGFVVVTITLLLAFIVMAILYSVTFVTQPIKSMAPIDMAYTKMLNDIVLLIVGGVGGIMSKRITTSASRALALATGHPNSYTPSPAPNPPPTYTRSNPMPDFNWMDFENPELDASWVAPPPPDTPPEHLEDSSYRVAVAEARREAAC